MDDFRYFCDDFFEKQGSLHHPVKLLSRVGGESKRDFLPLGDSLENSCGIALLGGVL